MIFVNSAYLLATDLPSGGQGLKHWHLGKCRKRTVHTLIGWESRKYLIFSTLLKPFKKSIARFRQTSLSKNMSRSCWCKTKSQLIKSRQLLLVHYFVDFQWLTTRVVIKRHVSSYMKTSTNTQDIPFSLGPKMSLLEAVHSKWTIMSVRWLYRTPPHSLRPSLINL